MCSKQHISSRLSRTLCICEWVLKIFLFFSHSKFNATAPGVKWLVFPWRVALELSRVIPSYSSRQWETHAFSDFGGKMGFLGHNVGFRHARRSRNGSIDAGDHLVSNKSLNQNLAHWIGVQGHSKLVKKSKIPPLSEPLPGKPLTKFKKNFFNRTKKTCCIRRGFEQLSSYSGWRVTKKARANLLARAVVKG